MRHWPLIIVLAFIGLFVVLERPSTSTKLSPPLVARAATDIGRSHQSQAESISEPPLQIRMFDFFRTHPDPGVREELPRLIRAFQVRTNWDPNGVTAAFLRYPQPKQGKVATVLSMSPDLFQSKNRARAQLVVYHEYQHYLQWRDGTIPEETFLYVPWSSDDLPRICTQKWYAEREAYQKECEFGRANGLINQLDLREGLAHICAAADEQFVPTLKRILPLGDSSAKACASTWATL